jgi:hypothetical protein
MKELTNVQIEVGNRLESVKGSPKQVHLKVGDQRIGSVLVWGENPSKNVRLNAAGIFWLHELLSK